MKPAPSTIFNLSLADQNYRLLKDEISKHKAVEKMPFGSVPSQQVIKVHEKANVQRIITRWTRDFIENMKLTLVWTEICPLPKRSAGHLCCSNETGVRRLRLGTPREAIGQQVFINDVTPVQMVGVVKDFCHFHYQYRRVIGVSFTILHSFRWCR